MNKYEQRDMSGTLWKNDNRTSEKHPNAKGSALIDGQEYWVSAWTKEGPKGKFQSLSFERKDKDAKPKARPKDEAWKARSDHLDDDVPF